MKAVHRSLLMLIGFLFLVVDPSPLSAQGSSVAGGIGLRSAGDGALSLGLSGRAPIRRWRVGLFLDVSAIWELSPDTLKAGHTRELDPTGRYTYVRDAGGRVNPKDARLSGPVAREIAARVGVEGTPWGRQRIWVAGGVGEICGATNDPQTGASGWQAVAGAGIELAGWTELAVDWRSKASGVRLALQLRPRW